MLDFLTVQGLHQVGIVGTSRGGIIAMMMAALRPTAMGAVVLNDIGPVIETRGLARIIGYVGRMPVPKTWADAVQILREINGRGFPDFSDPQWDQMAAACSKSAEGGWSCPMTASSPAPSALMDLSRPVPDLWPQFIALGQVPAFVLQRRAFRRAERRDARSHGRAPSQSCGP